jgi:alkylation response protein AidB-like acyl-CoA dehydrogenase
MAARITITRIIFGICIDTLRPATQSLAGLKVEFAVIVDADILRDSAQQFVAREYPFDVRQRTVREQASLAPEHWATFAELGWLGAALPEDAGGIGGSIAETAVIFEELGKALIAAPLLGCAVLAAQVFDKAANGGARIDMLGEVSAGRLRFALAHEEDGARGRLEHVDATAVARGDYYVVSGRKIAVLGAAECDRMIVSARLAGTVALLMLDPRADGIATEAYTGYDGLRAANITLTDVQVPASALVATGDAAEAALRWGYDQFLMAEAAVELGVMQAAFQHTRDYLRTRRQFGKALAEFQVLQHRLADMFIGIEEVRALHARCIALAQRFGQVDRAALAALAYRLRDVGRFVAMQSVQLHGGIGMTDEYFVGHCCRYLMVAGLRHGDTGQQLDTIAARYAA